MKVRFLSIAHLIFHSKDVSGEKVKKSLRLIATLVLRVSYNGITSDFQSEDESSILSTRSK